MYTDVSLESVYVSISDKKFGTIFLDVFVRE